VGRCFGGSSRSVVLRIIDIFISLNINRRISNTSPLFFSNFVTDDSRSWPMSIEITCRIRSAWHLINRGLEIDAFCRDND